MPARRPSRGSHKGSNRTPRVVRLAQRRRRPQEMAHIHGTRHYCELTYPEAVTWMRKRDHNIVTNAASLLVCGVLAGVVVAAAAFPGAAMSGLAAKAGAQTFDKLPSELFISDAPQISNLFASDRKTLIAMMYDENRRNITLDDVPKLMRDAIIAAEDHDFFKHNGVDIKGIVRAFVANRNAGATQ